MNEKKNYQIVFFTRGWRGLALVREHLCDEVLYQESKKSTFLTIYCNCKLKKNRNSHKKFQISSKNYLLRIAAPPQLAFFFSDFLEHFCIANVHNHSTSSGTLGNSLDNWQGINISKKVDKNFKKLEKITENKKKHVRSRMKKPTKKYTNSLKFKIPTCYKIYEKIRIQ